MASPVQETVDTITTTEYDMLKENQCPLPPRKYRYTNGEGKACSITTTAWFYKDKFWIRERDTRKIYAANVSANDLKKYKKRMGQMRNVDEYLSKLSITSSVEVYKILNTAMNRDALSPSLQGAFRGKQGEVTQAKLYAKKFNPTWMNRFGFWAVVFRAVLNAYFIVSNFLTIGTVPKEWRIGIFIVVGIEAVLFLIALLRTLYNLQSLLRRLCAGDTTHYQCKNLPECLRQMGSLSVMRYLPSGESLVLFKKRGSEWIRNRRAAFKFEMDNARKFKLLVFIRWIILTILDVIGPFVAIFSLLFKMAQLNFQFEAIGELQWFTIIGYFGFVNQVAGIRKVRKIEVEALEHFIFSGADIDMSIEENLLLDAWWNYTMVSCVANICDEFRFPVYDSIIFWYNLNVRRIQLLFKNHDLKEGKNYLKNKVDFTKYDNMINKKMTEHIEMDDKQIRVEDSEESVDKYVQVVIPSPSTANKDGDDVKDEDQDQDGNGDDDDYEKVDEEKTEN